MPKEFSRHQRVASAIQRELADLVRSEVRDDRLSLVGFNEVRVSKDLAHAKVYVSVLGLMKEQCNEHIEALNRAAGYLRKSLSQRLRMRAVPELTFVYDEVLDEGSRMDSLISQAVSSGPQEDQD